jgi:tRNA(Ile)-lysidine synthase
VRDTIARYRMVAEGETVVAAASGGPDSTAMVDLLAALADDLRVTLHVAHFNHRLRPGAAQDAAFVERMSRDLGIPYHEGSGETRAYAAREHLSLEDAARRLRYEFLVRVAREVGARTVATAHTRDDQAETVVMRLLRGSGLGGLAGIPPMRFQDGVRFIRPLIEVPRVEIEEYLRRRGIPWREDPTNRDPAIPRNLVRTVFLPAFEGYNPNIRHTLARLADVLRDEAEALDQLAAPHLAAVVAGGPGAVRIALEPFSRLPVALQRRALREAVRRIRGNTRGIEFVHIEGARRLALERRTGATYALPGGLRIRCLSETLEVSADEPARAAPGEYALEIPGSILAAEFGVQVVAVEVAAGAPEVQARAAHPTPQEIVLDRARTGGTLILRGPRPGDRFAPFGMGGRTKKVSDYLIERRVPRPRRRFVPILAAPGGEILWIVGMRAAESARVTSATTQALRVEVRRLWA